MYMAELVHGLVLSAAAFDRSAGVLASVSTSTNVVSMTGAFVCAPAGLAHTHESLRAGVSSYLPESAAQIVTALISLPICDVNVS